MSPPRPDPPLSCPEKVCILFPALHLFGTKYICKATCSGRKMYKMPVACESRQVQVHAMGQAKQHKEGRRQCRSNACSGRPVTKCTQVAATM